MRRSGAIVRSDYFSFSRRKRTWCKTQEAASGNEHNKRKDSVDEIDADEKKFLQT